jgi:hypothetical protein
VPAARELPNHRGARPIPHWHDDVGVGGYRQKLVVARNLNALERDSIGSQNLLLDGQWIVRVRVDGDNLPCVRTHQHLSKSSVDIIVFLPCVVAGPF